LIEATVIIAQIRPERLPTTKPPETRNLNKYNLLKLNISASNLRKLYGYEIISFTTPKSMPTPASTPYYPGSKKSLYNYNYNTDTGIQVQEEGYLNNVGTDQETLEARGSYNYIDNDGNTFQLSYIANEDGFQPEGAHLPTIPPLIKKALQYIVEHSKGNGKD